MGLNYKSVNNYNLECLYKDQGTSIESMLVCSPITSFCPMGVQIRGQFPWIPVTKYVCHTYLLSNEELGELGQ